MRDGLSKLILAATVCAGSIQNASTREIARAMVTTSGITRMKSPRMPGNSINGMNAAMVVSTAVVTGRATSRSDSTAAVKASTPWRKR